MIDKSYKKFDVKVFFKVLKGTVQRKKRWIENAIRWHD